MVDGLVYLVDGLRKALAGDAVVAAEPVLEVGQLVLEVRDVDVLLAHERELLAVLKRRERRVAQKRDDGDEELGAHHVHLLVLVGHVGDAGVQLVVRLEQRHEHGVLAALLAAIGVQLLEVRLVGLSMGGVVGLVLHLKHDGDDLVALLVEVAEDEVALGALHHLVVLLEVGAREGRRAQAVELDLAVLLQRLAEHLRGKARPHVLDALDLPLAVGDELVLRPKLLGQLGLGLGPSPGQLGLGAGLLRLQLVARPLHFAAQIVPLALDGHLGVLGCGLGPLHRDLRAHGSLRALTLQLLGQLVPLALHRAQPLGLGGHRIAHGQLARNLSLSVLGGQLRSQALHLLLQFRFLVLGSQLKILGLGLEALGLRGNLAVALGDLGAQSLLGLGDRQRHLLLAAFLGQRHAGIHLALELLVAHLVQNGGVPALVHGERLAAMGALDLVAHETVPSCCSRKSYTVADAAARSSAGRVQQFQRLDGRKGDAPTHDPQIAEGDIDLAHGPFGLAIAAALVVAAAHHVPAVEVRDEIIQCPGLVVGKRPARFGNRLLCVDEIVVAAQRREGHELAGAIGMRPSDARRHRRIQGRLGPGSGLRTARARVADLLPPKSREHIHFPSHGALPPWCSARDQARVPSGSCP